MVTTIENHVAEILIDYAMSKGCTPEKLKDGLWTNKVDDQWEITMNGKDEVVENIPPFSWSIKFNGWPAGILGVMGDGILCAGSHGNEENLKKALIKNLAQ